MASQASVLNTTAKCSQISKLMCKIPRFRRASDKLRSTQVTAATGVMPVIYMLYRALRIPGLGCRLYGFGLAGEVVESGVLAAM